MNPKKPKYSGDLSTDFWRRISAIKSVRGEMVYAAGCVLQNLEGVFLGAERSLLDDLEEAERKAKSHD